MDDNELREASEIVRFATQHLEERREYRDWLILQAIDEGKPYRWIAEVAGVTYGRVGQIAMINRRAAQK